jgi:hemolysin activation/secretion protein
MALERFGRHGMKRRSKRHNCLVFFLVLLIVATGVHAQETEQGNGFEIKAFLVEGNTIFSDKKIQNTLADFKGSHKTAADVEKARDALEQSYHEEGYPAVLVNIPEQTVEQGIVRLQVIESKLDRIRITGNRYFTMDKILKGLPAFGTGEILYVPQIQKEINKINRNPDFKVTPVLMPGRTLGTIDVELKVEDRLPLHGSLDVNNRSSHDTSELRLNAMIRYDNLWQKEHSLSFQYQTSPEEPEEVQVFAGSYVLPAPWNEDHLLAVYGILSDSETSFGEGFQVIGKGNILGARSVMSLPPHDFYAHNITIGLDYKDFDETAGYQNEEEGIKTPITYMPLSFSYNSSLPDSSGSTQISASLNIAFRGLVTDQREFEVKRFKGKGNYMYVTAGAERTQKLPAGMSLFLRLDGQLSDQPLISNEQYPAGGMGSVRGYKENEVLGDDAVHGTLELSAPDLAEIFGLSDKMGFTPRIFYDVAALRVKDPLPEQDRNITIQGAGGGVQGFLTRYMEYELDWAVALSDTDRIEKGDSRIHFNVTCQF